MLSALSLLQPSQSETRATPSGITEVVLANDQGYELLMPTLAYMSQCTHSRWFTWISPQGITPELLTLHGFNPHSTRFVHPLSTEQAFATCKRALQIGNSASVIASLGRLSNEQFAELERAASEGGSSGLLLRYR